MVLKLGDRSWRATNEIIDDIVWKNFGFLLFLFENHTLRLWKRRWRAEFRPSVNKKRIVVCRSRRDSFIDCFCPLDNCGRFAVCSRHLVIDRLLVDRRRWRRAVRHHARRWRCWRRWLRKRGIELIVYRVFFYRLREGILGIFVLLRMRLENRFVLF